MWTISCILFPPCWTFFKKVSFGASLLSSSLHLTASRPCIMSPPVLCIPVLGKPFVVRTDHIWYPHWGCAWAVWSTGCVFFVQIVSHGVQLSSDWPQTPSYLPRMSAVALSTCMGQSQQWSIQITKCWWHLFTQPLLNSLLDMLGGKASWVPLWTYSTSLALPTLLLMDSHDHLLLLSCSLSLILPCISL